MGWRLHARAHGTLSSGRPHVRGPLLPDRRQNGVSASPGDNRYIARSVLLDRYGGALAASPILSCVLVSKSPASWRSCNWLAGSPQVRLTMRPRFTAGRLAMASVQRCTFLYASTARNSPAPYSKPFAKLPYQGHTAMSAIV